MHIANCCAACGAIECYRDQVKLWPLVERRRFAQIFKATRPFCARRQTREIPRCARWSRALRFAWSTQAPRLAGIFRHLPIAGKQYRLCGRAGRIRTHRRLNPRSVRHPKSSTRRPYRINTGLTNGRKFFHEETVTPSSVFRPAYTRPLRTVATLQTATRRI
jgi:hypothetical protein